MYRLGKDHFLLIIFSLIFIDFCESSLTTWINLGLVGSSSPDDQMVIQAPTSVTQGHLPTGFSTSIGNPIDWCDTIPGLVGHQVILCKRYPDVFRQLKGAAQLAVRECQHQFRSERWNCTTTNDRKVFGKSVTRGNKETAFITAISTAAVVYSVVKACSSGNLTSCGCDARLQGQRHPNGWRWGGCSDHIEYGMWFSRQFNDAPEEIKRKDARGIKDAMLLHNKAAGRVAVHRQMRLQCRCHGVSGSCEMKTCWRSMAPFRDIAANLKEEYDRAVRLGKKYNLKLKRRGKLKKNGMISQKELVFLERSPNYCSYDPSSGILGTSGRQCNITSHGHDSCSHLCCGRGYNKIVERRPEKCECKFKWCCSVTCKTCFRSAETYTCK